MNCPRCGMPMNRHAVREREPWTPEEVARADRHTGLVNEEYRSCPKCHLTESRLA